MGDETFAETFKRIIKYEDQKCFFQTESIFQKSIELMEIYFDKLNTTELANREIFIANKLFPAILKYSSNDTTTMINERYKHTRPTDKKAEIEKNIKIIKNFEDMIYKYLDGEKVEDTISIEDKEELERIKPNEPDFIITLMAKNGKKQNAISQLLETSKKLKTELETKKFYYFQSDKFYKLPLFYKKEIERMLIQYAKDENLKGYTVEIKQFKDNL